ncbi:MAG: DUF6290 family protein [Clostridiales bacterium]|nr:DUF6290 family protein [Clostridiales bacterium]
MVLTVSVELTDEDIRLFNDYAKEHDMTSSELVKASIYDIIENSYDLQELREAVKNSTGVSYTIDEVDKILGFT